MRTIHKFPLNLTTETDHSLKLERHSIIRHVGIDPQTDQPALWIERETSTFYVMRRFRVYGTGHEIIAHEGERLDFLGTCITNTGLVWHIYEVVT